MSFLVRSVRSSIIQRRVLTAAAAAVLVVVAGRFVFGQSFVVIHRFVIAEGTHSVAPLFYGSDGNFYGAAYNGGTNNLGSIFRMTPAGAVTNLFSFSNVTNAPIHPSGVMRASDGNLYGTTFDGSSHGGGIVFKIDSVTGFAVLHEFAPSVMTGEGSTPYGGVIEAADGFLYGTTNAGGTHGAGTVFKISKAGDFSTVYSFNDAVNGDGGAPRCGVIQGEDGALYGTLSSGITGTGKLGSAYKVTTTGTFTKLHSFAGADGTAPHGCVIQASDHNLYGLTYNGGAHNEGTIYRLSADGATFQVLHDFNTPDGYNPQVSLVEGTDGNLYGAAPFGGTDGQGTVFRITKAGEFTKLHDFLNANNGADGIQPESTIVRGPNGVLYGMTQYGGSIDSGGVVYTLTTACCTPGDYDGDHVADLTVFRPSSGAWYTLFAAGGFTNYMAHVWGQNGDVPVAGDYDGDGKSEIAVFRPANAGWYVLLSASNWTTYFSIPWGLAADIPVPGDYDGDCKTDLAVFRPSSGAWYVRNSTTNGATFQGVTWGANGDVPAPGDYDGDLITDMAIFRPSAGAWYIRNSSTNGTTFRGQAWGLSTDVPTAADYDGDGKADVAVFRPSSGAWYISQSSNSAFMSRTWGSNGDVPVPGDYDGDGKADVAVFRPSTGAWYIFQSSTSTFLSRTWGANGDIPINRRP